MKIIQNNEGNNLTKSEKQYLVILGLTIFLSSFYVFGNRGTSPQTTELTFLTYGEETPDQMTDNKIDEIYEALDVRASSILIFNSNTKEEIYTKDTQKVMPLASLVKIMTTIVGLENTEPGEVIQIPKEALKIIGDNGILADEKWERDDLLRFMLITSSNDAARALAMHVGKKLGATTEEESVNLFVDRMNKKANELGLLQTVFLNESGLDIDIEKNGGYSTAKEIVSLFDYAIHTYPDIFGSTAFGSQTFVSLSSAKHDAQNTNPNTGQVAGISASKTGFTSLSGGNLIVSFKAVDGSTIIVGALGSSFFERFTDIQKLSSTTLKLVNEVQL